MGTCQTIWKNSSCKERNQILSSGKLELEMEIDSFHSQENEKSLHNAFEESFGQKINNIPQEQVPTQNSNIFNQNDQIPKSLKVQLNCNLKFIKSIEQKYSNIFSSENIKLIQSTILTQQDIPTLQFENEETLTKFFKTLEKDKVLELPAILLDTGDIYQGEWKNGKKYGYGKQVWSDGSQYIGNWIENKANGQGKLIHADGDIYEGNWVNDQAHGYGNYLHTNGALYVGDWVHDLQHGVGKEFQSDGAQYEGDYVNGKKEGKGQVVFCDGSKYAGEFVKNQISGFGEYYWANGKQYKGILDKI